MKATAVKDFTASMGGREFDCEAGVEIEADAKTIKQLEAVGLVTTSRKVKGRKPGKAGSDD